MTRNYLFTLNPDSVYLEKGVKLTLPMTMTLNGVTYPMHLEDSCGESAVYGCGTSRVRLDFDADCVRIAFEHIFPTETGIYESVCFSDGIKLSGFDRVLSTQPRNNGGLNMEFFSHLPDISANAYYSPAELNMILGSPDGWCAIGLLDLPDSKLCRLNPDMSILVESCGGNKKVMDYKAPELIVTFPDDEWQAVSLFREKLIEYGRYTPSKPKYSCVPAWWKDPLICTYGDQVVEDRVGALIDEKWVDEFVRIAEDDWGIEHMNLVIDDSWQHIQTFTPVSDSERFPDMRRVAEKLHERGHHLILWTQPLFENVLTGIVPLSAEMGMLTDCLPSETSLDYYKGATMIDYTHDNAREYLRRVCKVLFGSGEGDFNADGVKLDFIDTVRDPSRTRSYAHPERGVGIKELYNFFKMFSEEARAVKADVIIDCTVGDPRFEDFLTHLRLHDTHAGVEEKEYRARLVSLACPDALIDSDGALMYSSWLARHYINAAIYSIPSNYYLKGYQDYRHWEGCADITPEEAKQLDLTPRQKLAYGRLFSLAKYRPDGHAITDGAGTWKLIGDDGQVRGISLYGDTVIYYPTRPGESGYIFTLRDEAMTVPLYGRKVSDITPSPVRDFFVPDYARDRMTVHLLPGTVHTFRWDENAVGIEKSFGK